MIRAVKLIILLTCVVILITSTGCIFWPTGEAEVAGVIRTMATGAETMMSTIKRSNWSGKFNRPTGTWFNLHVHRGR